ncbi:hypothetical protein BSKO_05961 [Bryopsis sp. KO-2023]|nr:hypothetical protein BSKO_05961 [Bryopsis sp. KO-2023]
MVVRFPCTAEGSIADEGEESPLCVDGLHVDVGYENSPPSTQQNTSKKDSTQEHDAGVSITVAVRVRPLIARETVAGARNCIETGDQECLVLGGDRRFAFDYLLGPTSSQADVYNKCVTKLLDGCFKGYNATVLAYGQTGSGKTFTMGTGHQSSNSNELTGIVPRLIRDVFDRIGAQGLRYSVKVQFLEIHNEEVKDLLSDEVAEKAIAIRETGNGQIMVLGATEKLVSNTAATMAYLRDGLSSRATGETLLNRDSSRSHAIFTIILHHKTGETKDGMQEVQTAKFHLVDLAGSERAKKSGATGKRLKETVHINQGLLALGNVISALGDEPKRGHVPYRESKLTRLLQDSLGGNSKTCFLACVSSGDDSFDETLNVLKYADRAKSIRNKPTVNKQLREFSPDINAEILSLQLRLLKEYLLDLRGSETAVPDLILEDWEGVQSTQILEELKLCETNLRGPGSKHSTASCTVANMRTEMDSQKSIIQEQDEEINRVRSHLEEVREHNRSLQTDIDACAKCQFGILQEVKNLEASGKISSHASSMILGHIPDVQLASSKDAGESVVKEKNPTPLRYNSNQHQRILEAKIRQRDAELTRIRHELEEAQNLLDGDETLFAEKTTEIEHLNQALDEMHQLEAAHEKRHQEEVERLKQEIEVWKGRAASAQATPEPIQAWKETDDEVVEGASFVMDGDIESFISETDYREAAGASLFGSNYACGKFAGQDTDGRVAMDSEQSVRSAWQSQLADLEEKIEEKENHIQKLQESEKEARNQSQQFQARMAALEQHIATKETEMIQLRQDLEVAESDWVRTAEEKTQIRFQYEEKIAKVNEQMAALKRQLVEQHSVRAEKERLRAQRQAQKLQDELSRHIRDVAGLKQKLQEKTELFDKRMSDRRSELKKHQRDSDRDRKRIMELEEENKKQLQELKRKDGQVVAAQQRLRHLAMDPKALQSFARKEAMLTFSRTQTARNDLDVLTPGLETDRQVEWFDREVEKVVRKRQAEQELHGLKKRRQHLVTEKDGRSKALEELDDQIDSLGAELQYVVGAIVECERKVASSHSAAEGLRRRIQALGGTEARNVLRRCIDEWISAKTSETEARAKVEKVEAGLSESNRELDTAKNALAIMQTRVNATGKQPVVAGQNERSRQTESAAFSGGETDNRSKEGGKENTNGLGQDDKMPGNTLCQSIKALSSTSGEEFCQHKNHDVKQRLKEALEIKGEGIRSQDGLGKRNPVTSSGSLTLELDSYKARLRKLGTPVRISRSQLRPMSADDLQAARKG